MNLIKELEKQFNSIKDPAIAVQQKAYMRNLFPFLGIKKPLRAKIQKEAWKRYPLSHEEELIEALTILWQKPEREYQYSALDLAYHYKKLWTPKIFLTFEELIRTKSWWDTVDLLASKQVGTLLSTHPELTLCMDKWIDDEDIWIRRSAIIYQLSYKETTDHERLFRYCKLRMHEKEFFIRKAIGWALRHYARTDPQAVIDFITKEKESLSPLSYREAGKHCFKELQ